MMEKTRTSSGSQQEINLKLFVKKLLKHKLFFVLSIGFCVAVAFVYIKLATPIFEISTSILIDPSGKQRILGESQYVQGGVSLIEAEKNLYNEIGIIKSFSLVRQTVEDLGFDISYHSKKWLTEREHYKYFPFEVILLDSGSRLLSTPFKVDIISDKKYRLSIDTKELIVSNPTSDVYYKVEKDFTFSKEFSFGQEVNHDYFNIIVKKPDYKVVQSNFDDLELFFVIHNLDGVANGYLSKLKVNNIDIQASIFKISTYGAVVKKEIDFLNELTANYIGNKLIDRNKIASSKEDFIENQLMIISDSLLKAERNLESFKRDQNAVDLGALASNAINQSEKLQMEKARIELDIKYYNSLIQYLEDSLTSENFTVPTAVGLNDPILIENIMELKRLHAEKTEKEFFITKNNQEMEILREQIEESADLLMSNLRNSIKSLQLALREVNMQLSSHKDVISSLPSREKELVSIQRQSSLYENLYKYLSQELAKTGIARAESFSDTRVLDPPRMVGSSPVEPQKKLLLLLAVVIGSMIPLAWIILHSSLDETIQSVGQIEEHSDIPVLASIAHYGSKSRLSDKDVGRWQVKESFRDLSANLNFLIPNGEGCVIGITSNMPNEGKSFCAVNLAITLAEAGKKTLIIDTDLRQPSLVGDLSKIEGRGLSNFLKGELNSLKDIVYPHKSLRGLHYIPTPVVEGNLQKLLSGNRMKSLLKVLKEKYDIIILDTPAFGVVSDYLMVLDKIDMNLFVVRNKVSKLAFLNDFKKINHDGKQKLSGIIFNDAEGKEHKYGYGYKYGVNKEPQLISTFL